MPVRRVQIGGPPVIPSQATTAWAGDVTLIGQATSKVITGLNTYIHNASTKYLYGGQDARAVSYLHTGDLLFSSNNNGTMTITKTGVAWADNLNLTFNWWAFHGGSSIG